MTNILTPVLYNNYDTGDLFYFRRDVRIYMEKLKCVITASDGLISVGLSGVIDHHTVRKVREDIDSELYKNGVK